MKQVQLRHLVYTSHHLNHVKLHTPSSCYPASTRTYTQLTQVCTRDKCEAITWLNNRCTDIICKYNLSAGILLHSSFNSSNAPGTSLFFANNSTLINLQAGLFLGIIKIKTYDSVALVGTTNQILREPPFLP